MKKTKMLALVGPFLAMACASGETPDGPGPGGALSIGSDGSTDSAGSTGSAETDGDTDTIFEEGTWWCTRAASASFESSEGVIGIPLRYPEGDSPEGCECASQDVHDWLLFRLEGNEVVVDDDVLPGIPGNVVNFRDNVYQNAANACNELLPDGYLSSNCNDGKTEGSAIDAEGYPDFQHPGLYQGGRDGQFDCSLFSKSGAAPPKCEFVGAGYGVVLGQGTYSVPSETFENFFFNPGCLLVEGGRVDATSTGYEFTGINRGTLLWELGLRTGDVPLSIDGMPLRTVEDAFSAYDALRDDGRWVLKIKRGSRNMTLTYEVI